MLANSKSEIDHFFAFFRERLEFVKSRCLDRIEGKILLCSYCDSLSKYTYGGSSNYDRFRKFLIECTEEGEIWRKISLMLLRQYGEKKNEAIYQPLIEVLNRLQASNRSFTNLSHNPDIPKEELVEKCKERMTDSAIQAFKKDINRFEYTAIFWGAYRNAAVHETAVQLQEAMNLAGRSEPYYSNEQMMDTETKKLSATTRFGIPPAFMIASIESGLAYMRQEIDSGRLVLSLSKPYDEP